MKYIKNPILASIVHEELKTLQPGIKIERMVKLLKEIRKDTSKTYFAEDFTQLFQNERSPPNDVSYRNLGMLRALKIFHTFKDGKKTSYRITDLGKYVCIIEDDKMSLAIGRGGQNLRLASQLSGYQIEPIKESEYEAEALPSTIAVEDIDGLGEALKKKLIEGNVYYLNEIIEIGKDGLVEVKGIGAKTAEKILDVVNEFQAKQEDKAGDE